MSASQGIRFNPRREAVLEERARDRLAQDRIPAAQPDHLCVVGVPAAVDRDHRRGSEKVATVEKAKAAVAPSTTSEFMSGVSLTRLGTPFR